VILQFPIDIVIDKFRGTIIKQTAQGIRHIYQHRYISVCYAHMVDTHMIYVYRSIPFISKFACTLHTICWHVKSVQPLKYGQVRLGKYECHRLTVDRIT
jgi:hypothetical protein